MVQRTIPDNPDVIPVVVNDEGDVGKLIAEGVQLLLLCNTSQQMHSKTQKVSHLPFVQRAKCKAHSPSFLQDGSSRIIVGSQVGPITVANREGHMNAVARSFHTVLRKLL